jgi:hypothetical protein
MRISRVLVISLCSLLLGLLVASCQRAGEREVARTEEGIMRLGSVEVVDSVARAVAPNERPLVFEGMQGSVHVRGAESSTAELSFIRRGRGETQADGRTVLDGIAITERGTESAYTYTLAADRDDYAAVDVRGTVPRQTALQIDRLSGSVHVEGMEGALTIDHEYGDVVVRDAAAPVEATIKNGNVRISFRSVPAGEDMLVETGTGNLHLDLPRDVSAQIDAQTSVGVIRTQGLSFSAERLRPIDAGGRYNAQLGGGGPTIELRTENGSITIQARDTTQADTSGTALPQTVPSTDTTVLVRPSTDSAMADTTVPDTVNTEAHTASGNP